MDTSRQWKLSNIRSSFGTIDIFTTFLKGNLEVGDTQSNGNFKYARYFDHFHRKF